MIALKNIQVVKVVCMMHITHHKNYRYNHAVQFFLFYFCNKISKCYIKNMLKPEKDFSILKLNKHIQTFLLYF